MDPNMRQLLQQGAVIPAHPLALTPERKFDERRQAALSRYYCDAGAGGLALGVHTTQFAIREPSIGLYEPVLRLSMDIMREFERAHGKRLIRVAGICGKTKQAVTEARIARETGYDTGLLSLGAMRDSDERKLIDHCRCISEIIPLFGFYLQPAVGGRRLTYRFWRNFFEIENVAAVKVAPFNRYQTLDVVRALAGSGRTSEIALYTGNDDSIVVDLLSSFPVQGGESGPLHFAGGLLGHWAVWTRRAVELLDRARECRANAGAGAYELLALAGPVTDSNAALFDTEHNFAGCIAGIHEVLRRQGLLHGRWCLDPDEDLSPGQMDEIDRVCAAYPGLTDDTFVAANLDRWLK